MSEASIITILLFFTYTWGLGFTATAFLKKSDDFFERNIMNIGIGLGIILILGLVLNFIGIPLDWKIFLLISTAYPVFVLAKRIIKKELPKLKLESLRLTKANIYLMIVFLLFFATFYMYASGAFNYPYLEDDDPWSHSAGIKYVAQEKTVTPGEDIPGRDYFLPYLGPYPPGYDMMLGLLHQTSPHMMWTMKFFNALIISLGILFFYFFAKRLMKNSLKALFATFALAAIPCYLSHFIWAHAFFPTLFFVLIYCTDSIFQDKKYAMVSSLVLAGLLVTQPGHAIKIGILIALYIIVKSVSNWKFLMNFIYIYIPAGILSLTWWGTQAKEILAMRGTEEILRGAGATISKPLLQRVWDLIVKFFPPSSGTATRVYTFDDFFVAKSVNMINNPVGVGIVLYLLLFLFMLFMFIYIVQKTLNIAREQRTLFYALVIINFLAGIVMLLLSVRYVTALFGSPIFTSLYLDLYAMLLITILFGILYLAGKLKNREKWIMVVLLWLLFTFLGINSMTFNLLIGLMAFRFWMLFAIPAALIAAEGAWVLSSIMKKFKIPRVAVLVALAVMIILTSGIPKYQVNTAMWGPGATLGSTGQTMDYMWLKTLPPNTKVFALDEYHRYRIIGLDKNSCEWCTHIIETHKTAVNMTIEELHTFLKKEDYEYLIGGVGHMQLHGETAQKQINDLALSSDKFITAYQGKTTVVLKIV